MKQIAAPLLALSLLAAPVAAQEEDNGGFNLMEEGARLFFRGLMGEMEPALQELEDLAREMRPQMKAFMTEMGPALRDLLEEVEDWSVYEPPEILPNGDIIIRRKTPLDDEEPLPDNGEIEL